MSFTWVDSSLVQKNYNRPDNAKHTSLLHGGKKMIAHPHRKIKKCQLRQQKYIETPTHFLIELLKKLIQ
jgi:hypothetical protein